MKTFSFNSFGSTVATFMFIQQLMNMTLSPIQRLFSKIHAYLFPQIRILIPEHDKGTWHSNTFYQATQTYLRGTASTKANRLRATGAQGGSTVALTMDESENVTDEFRGAVFQWGYHCARSQNNTQSDKYYYTLKFNHRYRNLVVGSYLQHIIQTSRDLNLKNRKRKLYSNSTKEDNWTSVVFRHPANFQTLAMETNRKQEIMTDLTSFRNSKDYYAKIGKSWKRGYLLYGPPGTGKSTMIAAMSNFLEYDIYDLELTAVTNNVSLRKLLTNTTNKSILVIEDIDCSLGVSGDRKAKDKAEKTEKTEQDGKDSKDDTSKKDKSSKVTLSGLLNFIDGLWSAGGEERIVIFTTNHVKKLDPALIRRGRMDMHIELSYCTYEAFKVLAKNYLELDSHPLFDEIGDLLKNTNITPADVAEVLICDTIKTIASQATERLEELVRVLKKVRKKREKKRGDDSCVAKLEEKG